MRRAAIVLLGWGLWLVGRRPDLPAGRVRAETHPVLDPRRRRRGVRDRRPRAVGAGCAPGAVERPRLIAESSLATVTLVVGLAVVLLGAGFGLWLILIGVGIAALGFGGVVREQRARRHTLREEGSR